MSPPPPLGHTLKECTGQAKEKEGEFDEFAGTGSGVPLEKQFIFIRLCVLREVSREHLLIKAKITTIP